MNKKHLKKFVFALIVIAVVGLGAVKIFGSSSIGNDIGAQTVEQSGETKEFYVEAYQFAFDPSTITVNKGDLVKITAESTDVPHGFAINEYGINELLLPGEKVEIEFVADKTGTFTYYCSIPCGAGHSAMRGKLIVQ